MLKLMPRSTKMKSRSIRSLRSNNKNRTAEALSACPTNRYGSWLKSGVSPIIVVSILYTVRLGYRLAGARHLQLPYSLSTNASPYFLEVIGAQWMWQRGDVKEEMRLQ